MASVLGIIVSIPKGIQIMVSRFNFNSLRHLPSLMFHHFSFYFTCVEKNYCLFRFQTRLIYTCQDKFYLRDLFVVPLEYSPICWIKKWTYISRIQFSSERLAPGYFSYCWWSSWHNFTRFTSFYRKILCHYCISL